MKKGLVSVVLLLLSAVSHAGSTNSILAILRPEDPIPQSAVKLKQISFTGNDFEKGCAYYELMLRAQDAAGSMGANVMKVVGRSSHSRSQPCDQIEVAFYKDDAPRVTEQSFQWHADRPLTWDDFTGRIRSGAGSHTAAETSCGIAIETNLVSGNGKAKVYVFNTFDKKSSWVREGSNLPGILQHEQSHWDICELYTRIMQQRFDNAEITGANLNRKVEEIYQQVTDEYVARQELYEQQTQHGIIASEQARWTKMINEELNLNLTASSKP